MQATNHCARVIRLTHAHLAPWSIARVADTPVAAVLVDTGGVGIASGSSFTALIQICMYNIDLMSNARIGHTPESP